MNLELRRFGSIPDVGTYGELIAGDMRVQTIEQPWRNNKIGHSCVPCGKYELLPYPSPTFGNTYALFNPALNIYVTDNLGVGNERTVCLIHAANIPEELQGCIAVGHGFQIVTTKRGTNLGVVKSGVTFGTLKAILDGSDNNTITIREATVGWNYEQ